MATFKIASLAIRTLAKPVSNYLKSQAMQHQTFREICISVAQRAHRTEAKMRMALAGETGTTIKPLNDTRAIQNGANTLAESFLFMVAAGLILGEGWRSSNKASARRDDVDEKLTVLQEGMEELKKRWEGEEGEMKSRAEELDQRTQQLTNIISTLLHHNMQAPFRIPATPPGASSSPSATAVPSPSDSVGAGPSSTTTTIAEFLAAHPAQSLQPTPSAGYDSTKTVARIPILSLVDWDEDQERLRSAGVDRSSPEGGFGGGMKSTGLESATVGASSATSSGATSTDNLPDGGAQDA